MGSDVVLWHIPPSHFSEKVRWALDWKGVEYERRAPDPPLHMATALVLTRGAQKTFPLLRLDGRVIGDSTEIIAALEERFPQPALYPADEADRRRALELEDYFDEHVASPVRLLGWHELTRDRERLRSFASRVPSPLPDAMVAAGLRTFVNLRYGVASEEAAERARGAIVAAFDRLDAELGDRDYLVGDSFTVADLTAASLLYPLVLPPEAPQIFQGLPQPLDRFCEPLRQRRGWHWVQEMFRRHRKPVAAAVEGREAARSGSTAA